MRLLCDEMLRGLARWLRAAGHDTAVAGSGLDDCALLQRSAAEERVLLTKDRHLAAIAAPTPVVLLNGDDLDGYARALRDALGLDWCHAPFTRCLLDNAPLVPAGPQDAWRMPAASRAAGDPLRLCPVCGRVYWSGGHVRRMAARLARWRGD